MPRYPRLQLAEVLLNETPGEVHGAHRAKIESQDNPDKR